jgi:hypothetical protein
MEQIQTVVPPDNERLRRALYEGAIFRLAPVPATQRLVAEVLALIENELGQDGPIREAQFRRSGDELFQAVGRLRKRLFEERRFVGMMSDVVASFGFDPDENAFDPVRLRVMTHLGHENPRAAPVYYAHRDTWYAHPQCQISWWVPLHDLTEQQTFVFFPDHLRQGVENDSGKFNYDDWVRGRDSLRIGWQDKNAGLTALYPATHADLSAARRVPFACRAAEVILFAGAHLHQSVPNETGLTRFSVDFRTVHLRDHQSGIGAPNADNRSTGSALQHYVHPPGSGLPAAVSE